MVGIGSPGRWFVWGGLVMVGFLWIVPGEEFSLPRRLLHLTRLEDGKIWGKDAWMVHKQEIQGQLEGIMWNRSLLTLTT